MVPTPTPIPPVTSWKEPTLWVSVGVLATSLLTLLINFLIERYRTIRQLELKKYEVEFLEKRKSFVELFKALRNLTNLAMNHQPAERMGSVFANREEIAALDRLSAALGEESDGILCSDAFLASLRSSLRREAGDRGRGVGPGRCGANAIWMLVGTNSADMRNF